MGMEEALQSSSRAIPACLSSTSTRRITRIVARSLRACAIRPCAFATTRADRYRLGQDFPIIHSNKGERIMRDSAKQWMDGQISIGKLLSDFQVPRGTGDDLVGALWHAWSEQVFTCKSELENKKAFAEKSYEEARQSINETDMTAESASILAYTVALSSLQLHISGMLERTSAGYDANESVKKDAL